jgi:hypothetical protein
MTRVMIDCIRANAHWVAANLPVPDIIGWYGTGSPEIQWTEAERALFPRSIHVQIDQGAHGSPIANATVRDVEPHAWGATSAVTARPWTAQRPTIYADRNDMSTVVAAGWKGDVWLAWPDYSHTLRPSVPGCNVVAVQNVFHQNYDQSVVYDNDWPYLPPKEAEMIYTQVDKGGKLTIPFPAGSFSHVMFAHDFTNASAAFDLRVAVRSATKGYSVHTIRDAVNGPVVFTFTQPDIDAISVVNTDGPDDVGITLA